MATVIDPPRFSPNEDWLKLSQAFRGMFWPMFFIGLDFHFGVNQFRLNFLPAALGWYWMYAALGPVAQLSPMLLLLRRLALCLILLQLPYVIKIVERSARGGVRFNLPELPTMDYWTWGWGQWASVTSLMTALFLWCLGGVIIKLAVSKDNQWLAVRARFRRVLYVIPVVLIPWLTALVHVSWASFVGLMIGFGLCVVVAVFLYAAMTSLAASFCRQQAYADDGQSPDFSGKESSALENALRTEDPQKPFRFSLWTLILLMSVIGMASSQIHLIRASQQSADKLINAQEEIDFLKDQLDELRVRDRDKMYIRRVPVREDLNTEWRVFIPPGELYQLHVKFSDIPDEGIPDEPADIVEMLRGGESIIKFSMDADDGPHGTAEVNILWDDPGRSRSYRSYGNGKMIETTKVQSRLARYRLKEGEDAFYKVDSFQGLKDIEVDGKSPADVGAKPIVFYRLRNYNNGPTNPAVSQSRVPKGDSRGLVMWIEKMEP